MADIKIFIIEAETDPVRLNVNGNQTVIKVGVDATVDELFVPALRDAHVTFRLVGEAGASTVADAAPEVEEPTEPANEQDEPEQPETPAAPTEPAAEQDPPVDPDPTETPPVDAFKPDEIIAGNVKTVEARLAVLTDEQLALVVAAEKDREQPRSSILAAIEKLIAARA